MEFYLPSSEQDGRPSPLHLADLGNNAAAEAALDALEGAERPLDNVLRSDADPRLSFDLPASPLEVSRQLTSQAVSTPSRVAADYYNNDSLQYDIPRNVHQRSQSHRSNFLLTPRSYLANGLQSFFMPQEAGSILSAQTRLPAVPGYLLEDDIHDSATQRHLEHSEKKFAQIELSAEGHPTTPLAAPYMEKFFDTNPSFGAVNACAYQAARIQLRFALLHEGTEGRLRSHSSFKQQACRIKPDFFFLLGQHHDFNKVSRDVLVRQQIPQAFSESSVAKTTKSSVAWHHFLGSYQIKNTVPPLLDSSGTPRRLPTVHEMETISDAFFAQEVAADSFSFSASADFAGHSSFHGAQTVGLDQARVNLGGGSTVFLGRDLYAPCLAFFSTIALQVAWDFKQQTVSEVSELWNFSVDLPQLCPAEIFLTQREALHRLQKSLTEKSFLRRFKEIFNDSESLEHQTEMRIRKAQIQQLRDVWGQSSIAFFNK